MFPGAFPCRISNILVSLDVLTTKHHHFSSQSIVQGALEEIIIKSNALFLISVFRLHFW